MRPDRIEPSTAPGFDRDITCQTTGRAARPPVPTEIAGALADLRERPPGTIGVDGPLAELRLATLRFLERALQHHFEEIPAGTDDLGDIEPDRDVLGVDRSDTDVIETYLSHRVQRIEDEIDPLLLAERLRNLEDSSP